MLSLYLLSLDLFGFDLALERTSGPACHHDASSVLHDFDFATWFPPSLKAHWQWLHFQEFPLQLSLQGEHFPLIFFMVMAR